MTDSQSVVNETAPFQLMSLQLRNMFFRLNSVPILVFALLGSITNPFNMLTFHRMGLRSTTNISFFALSFADFACGLIFGFVAVIRLDMSRCIDLGVDLTDIQYLLFPVVMGITAFGSWVTAIISVERCCCVAFPVKVKKLFTLKTTLCLIMGMLVFQTANITSSLTRMRLRVDRSPDSDRPRVVLDRSRLDNAVYASLIFWTSSFLTLICFGLIVASTIFLGIVLRQRGRWLQSLAEPQNDAIERDKKLVHTVAAISLIYIICFLPGFTIVLVSIANPALNPLNPRAVNLILILATYVALFQSLSGAINFFIYFRINVKFKKCLRDLLSLASTRFQSRTRTQRTQRRYELQRTSTAGYALNGRNAGMNYRGHQQQDTHSTDATPV